MKRSQSILVAEKKEEFYLWTFQGFVEKKKKKNWQIWKWLLSYENQDNFIYLILTFNTVTPKVLNIHTIVCVLLNLNQIFPRRTWDHLQKNWGTQPSSPNPPTIYHEKVLLFFFFSFFFSLTTLLLSFENYVTTVFNKFTQFFNYENIFFNDNTRNTCQLVITSICTWAK